MLQCNCKGLELNKKPVLGPFIIRVIGGKQMYDLYLAFLTLGAALKSLEDKLLFEFLESDPHSFQYCKDI
jgi:hypothetical protein